MLTIMPFMLLQNKFLLFATIAMLLLNNTALSSGLPVLSAKLDLLSEDNWCVKLTIKNVSDKDVFIESIGPVFRGSERVNPLTPFYVFSAKGKRYEYTGPLDERRYLKEDDFVSLKSDEEHKNCFCLGDLFTIDEGLSEIYYEEVGIYYNSPDESDPESSDHDLTSNVISFQDVK